MPASITDLAGHWLATFDRALAAGDPDAVLAAFDDECYWRDLVAFTWNIRTMEGRTEIGDMLRATLAGTRPSGWQLDGEPAEANGVVEAWFRFETGVGRGRGIARLRDGRAWTLLTALQELKGHEEPAGERRPLGVDYRIVRGRRSWLDEREETRATLGITKQPYCLIVGGGQGGIGLAARLKRLGVPTLVIDRLERPGDAWRRRYRSLCLHDPV